MKFNHSVSINISTILSTGFIKNEVRHIGQKDGMGSVPFFIVKQLDRSSLFLGIYMVSNGLEFIFGEFPVPVSAPFQDSTLYCLTMRKVMI